MSHANQAATSAEQVSAAGAPIAPLDAAGKRSRPSLRKIIMFGSFLLMLVIFTLAKPDTFWSGQNLANVINALPILAMLAIGVTVVLILGEFDLSVPYVAALTTVTVAVASTQTGMPFVLVLVIGLVLATLIGSVNGAAVGYGKAPAFVVTLAVGSMAAGIELFVQSKIDLGHTSVNVTSLSEPLQNLSLNHWIAFGDFQLEIATLLLVIVAVVVGIVMTLTPWGRHVTAIGGNEIAARLAGVPVRRTKVLAFTLTGLLAGFAGILFAGRAGYFNNALPAFLLPAYAAAFFGAAGVGKRGFSVPATMFGAVYLAVLSNGLTILNVPTWVGTGVQGVVLFAAVLLARSKGRA